MKRELIWLFVMLCFVIFLVWFFFCPPLPTGLGDRVWHLESVQVVGGRTLWTSDHPSRFTVEFNPTGIKGYAGCNYVSGKYLFIRFTSYFSTWWVYQTAMACSDADLQKKDKEFIDALLTPTRYTLDEHELRIYFDKATKVLVFRMPEPAATLAPAATPTPMPVPPELVRRWTLVHVVVNGEVGPPFDSNQWIRFTSARAFEAWDGCNEIWGKAIATDSNGLRVHIEDMTAAKCVDRDTGETIRTGVPFRAALGRIVAHKIRYGELWLYTSSDKSNALVFR
jgi:heat shock protein HslJ